MTAIAQMQVRFDAEQDRLLLRVRSRSGEELRFWLTRRYVRLAMPVLLARMEPVADTRVAANPEARRALASFEHEQAVQGADFSTPFSDAPRALPLGEEPVLLARFGLRDNGASGVVLGLHPESGQGVDLALSRPMLHSFCKLVGDAVRTADWQIELDLPRVGSGAPSGVAH